MEDKGDYLQLFKISLAVKIILISSNKSEEWNSLSLLSIIIGSLI